MGLGVSRPKLVFYLPNLPNTLSSEDTNKLKSFRAANINEIKNIIENDGNHWAKIFSIMAKIAYAIFNIEEDKIKTWQEYRDQVLLTEDCHVSLVFSDEIAFNQTAYFQFVSGLEKAQRMNFLDEEGEPKRGSYRFNPFLSQEKEEVGTIKYCRNVFLVPYLDYRQFPNSYIEEIDFYFKNKRSISKQEINFLPNCNYPGKINVIESKERCAEAVNNLIDELRPGAALGFDTETKPCFKKGQYHKTALLQLSTIKSAYLFRLNKIGLPQELKELLENKNIKKAGVAIRDDLKELRKICEFTPNGFIEIADMAKALDIENLGLRALAGLVLGIKINKNAQLSNWENHSLSRSQQYYAAIDAWIGLRLYTDLSRMNKDDAINK